MPDQVYMLIAHQLVDVIVSPWNGTTSDKVLQLSMTWKFSDWYLTRVCYPSSSRRFTTEGGRQRIRARTMDRGRTHWLYLLRFPPATENLYLFESRIMHCVRPTRAPPRRSNRNVAGAPKYFHRASPVIRTCWRSHWGVCWCETALRSPGGCPVLGTRTWGVSWSGCGRWSLSGLYFRPWSEMEI